jgi:hypothetical protein
MSPKAVKNFEAAVVLMGAVALLIWVPQRWFLEVALSMLAGAGLGLFALKKYLDLLARQTKKLKGSNRPDEATVLQVRRLMLIDLGVALAIVGLVAFIGLIVVYGD